ncbi:hypothetical protein BALOs_0779 [Halobacteriovorax sp. BALOs_7]|uniref:hypothetical protein n=1 Tax=Halobacteriovorax sp. BALOs_7 TaxID=2109558 RepID=UPI000EA1143E|nr:hypothetical protein [Halobacteriovorax sp. BALOs_7]AYF43789.1 hypothetical protein BALOs_0779 [Halobacteriovorax sp. BALOs_7]
MEVLEKALNLPWYVYLCVFLAIVFIFGKSRDWVYTAKLYREGSEDVQGDFEIKKYKNEAPIGEVLLVMSDFNVDGEIEIKVNDELIGHLKVTEKGRYVETIYPPSNESKSKKYRPKTSIRMKRLNFSIPSTFIPKNRDKVCLSINGEKLTGPLFKS